MIDSIVEYLPEQYGRVETNFHEMPVATNIGIVLPTFSRHEFLLKTLESLRKSSLPKDCMLVIVDETMASKQPTCEQFEYFESIDFAGGDIKQVNREFDEIRKEAERLDSCVAFNDAGWLKHSLSHAREIKSSRFGTYIKKSFLQKNPTLYRDILQRVLSYKSTIDTRTVVEIEAFDIDVPVIKIYKKQHKNMFDSLRTGFDLLTDLYKVDYLVNIDSDTIHKEDWLTTLYDKYMELNRKITDGPLILSGFNANKKKNLYVRGNYVVKKDLGGINLFFDTQTYRQYVRDTLVHVGWDIELSKIIRSHDGLLVALYNSVIQHIGTEGMWSRRKDYDYSSTFQSSGSPPGGRLMQLLTILKKKLRL
jgi:hypothetical protein